MADFSITPLSQTQVSDQDLEALLKSVYVDGGFTNAALGDTMFRARDIKARGEVLVAVDERGQLLGVVIIVFPGSPACRLATRGEAELQLLGVRADRQRRGVGTRLVDAAIATARAGGAVRMLLWTQPAMENAQRLYEKRGFAREPSLDFSRGERTFRVYARAI